MIIKIIPVNVATAPGFFPFSIGLISISEIYIKVSSLYGSNDRIAS